jgi:histidine triad (HIT) family protein
MSECLFCRIVCGEIPADRIYESRDALVFRDINPQAPHHFLAIPKKHYPAIHDIPAAEVGELTAGLISAARKAIEIAGLDKDGYRLVVNSGDIAGQTVPHLHIHVLGGRELGWPPG